MQSRERKGRASGRGGIAAGRALLHPAGANLRGRVAGGRPAVWTVHGVSMGPT